MAWQVGLKDFLGSLHQEMSSINRWHNLPEEELPGAFAIMKLSRLEKTSQPSSLTRASSKGKERCNVVAVGWMAEFIGVEC